MIEKSTVRRGAWVAELTWPEVEARIHSGAVAVLPIGAGAKEHGPHLPMNADQSQAEWLADRLIDVLNVLIWPTVSYGYYPAFHEYPGSCSVPEDVFSGLVSSITEQILAHDIAKVCLLNTGVSTTPSLRRIVAGNNSLCLVNIYEGDHCRALGTRLLRQRQGGHADEMETSIMLAIAPGQVRLEQAVRWDAATPIPGPLRRCDANHPNYSPSGIVGDATLADARKGRQLIGAILTDVTEALASLVP